jgi:hypothetical protein
MQKLTSIEPIASCRAEIMPSPREMARRRPVRYSSRIPVRTASGESKLPFRMEGKIVHKLQLVPERRTGSDAG